jgi:APA family basic amino acid/polyamine antiporter
VERINKRYRTPHVALLLAGGPIMGLILFGRVEVLAEVASLLHLFMYGLICVALLVLRRTDPEGYAPSFRCPGYPVVPVLGAVASFGLVGFMNPLSIALGGGILLTTSGWYLYYARTVTISALSS